MFIIIDWANNHCFKTKNFNSFEDAWGFIYENIDPSDNAYDDYCVIKKYNFIEKYNWCFNDSFTTNI